MTPKEVLALLKGSKNENEWRNNCTTVMFACDGQYPDFWHELVVKSKLLAKMRAKWLVEAKTA
jgi:hypothetical protein